jgi:hypothetical protein
MGPKKRFLFIGLIISGLIILNVILIFTYFNRSSKKSASTTDQPPQKTVVDKTSSEIQITYSSDNQNSNIRTIVLNNLTLQKILRQNDQLILHVNFTYQGQSKKLTIPIIGSIYVLEIQSDTESALTPIDEIPILPNQLINLSFAYIPIDKIPNLDKFEFLTPYQKVGFGNQSIDPQSYLDQFLSQSNDVAINHQVLAPVTLYLIQ